MSRRVTDALAPVRMRASVSDSPSGDHYLPPPSPRRSEADTQPRLHDVTSHRHVEATSLKTI
ncbi:hypothetical protein JYU34_010665, partial [Plutella xylostella]